MKYFPFSHCEIMYTQIGRFWWVYALEKKEGRVYGVDYAPDGTLATANNCDVGIKYVGRAFPDRRKAQKSASYYRVKYGCVKGW